MSGPEETAGGEAPPWSAGPEAELAFLQRKLVEGGVLDAQVAADLPLTAARELARRFFRDLKLPQSPDAELAELRDKVVRANLISEDAAAELSLPVARALAKKAEPGWAAPINAGGWQPSEPEPDAQTESSEPHDRSSCVTSTSSDRTPKRAGREIDHTAFLEWHEQRLAEHGRAPTKAEGEAWAMRRGLPRDWAREARRRLPDRLKNQRGVVASR